MKTMFDFGQTLKDLRKKRKITQKQLAERCYLSDSTISKYESNAVTPTVEAVTSIAAFFNVSADYLLGMEKTINISTVQLTPEQIQILRDLAEAFRSKPSYVPRKISAVQHQIIGRIATEFEK